MMKHFLFPHPSSQPSPQRGEGADPTMLEEDPRTVPPPSWRNLRTAPPSLWEKPAKCSLSLWEKPVNCSLSLLEKPVNCSLSLWERARVRDRARASLRDDASVFTSSPSFMRREGTDPISLGEKSAANILSSLRKKPTNCPPALREKPANYPLSLWERARVRVRGSVSLRAEVRAQ